MSAVPLTVVDLGLMFATGLFGGLHCAGMCGPIVIGCSTAPVEIAGFERLRPPIGKFKLLIARVIPQLYYNSGRVVSYSIVGAIAGLIGTGLLQFTALQRSVGIGLGALLVGVGLMQTGVFRGRFGSRLSAHNPASLLSKLVHENSREGRFLIGVLTPLLPCGLLYGLALKAAATSSPIAGAAELAAFALGSAPALALIGVTAGSLRATLRRRGTQFAAVLMVLMGLVTVLRGAGVWVSPFEPAVAGTRNCCSSSLNTNP